MNEIGPNIAKALVEFQSEVPTVAKGQKATVKSDKGSYSYTYAGLPEVSAAALPLLSKHRLSFVALPTRKPEGYTLIGVLLHESGESIESDYPIQGNTPQQIGSSITYGRRYLLGSMTGIVTDDDDDGHLAQQAASRPVERLPATPPDDPWYDTQPKQSRQNPASQAQIKMIGALMSKAKLTERDDALKYVADVIGREVGSRNELTSKEATSVIEALKADLPAEERES